MMGHPIADYQGFISKQKKECFKYGFIYGACFGVAIGGVFFHFLWRF